MRILLILTVLLVACNPRNLPNEQLNLNFKLEAIKSVLLDTSNNLINRELILTDKGNLTPPSMGEFSSELPYLLNILDESDSAFIKAQFRERKSFSTSQLNSPAIRVLPLSRLNQDSVRTLLEVENIKGFYTVEMPIFNKTLTKAYLRLGYLCGPLCGHEDEVIIVRTPGTENWIVSEQLGFSVY
ncbi:MAG: hypothetical protein RJQ14_26200 [Marinoscillum sp.]